MPQPQRFDGGEFRRRRIDAGLSRTQLAVLIERHEAVVKLYEQGKVCPPAKVRARIAEAFGCEPKEIDLLVPGGQPEDVDDVDVRSNRPERLSDEVAQEIAQILRRGRQAARPKTKATESS